MIGVIAYQFLDSAIRAQEQGDESRESLAAIEQTWQLLASDLQNAIDRPVVTPATGADFLPVSGPVIDGEMRRPSMMSAQFSDMGLTQLLSRDGALLWFSRQGWVNPLDQPRSEIQRILYRLDDNGELHREYWPERNQLLSVPPEGSLLLLDNVRRVQFAFLAAGMYPDNNAWLAQWPPAAGVQNQAENGGEVSPLPEHYLPAAVRVTLEFSETDNNRNLPGSNTARIVERIFLLAASASLTQ